MAFYIKDNKPDHSDLNCYEICALIFFLAVCFTFAKSTPTLAQDRATAFRRAASLGKGINISWLEQTWDPKALERRPITSADLDLIKKLDFNSVRLPVAFKYYENDKAATAKLLKNIDQVWGWCKRYKLKLIIDYHYGTLADSNHTAQTKAIIDTWTRLARLYRNISANDLYFEIYNEPPPMDPQLWKDAAYNIVTAIRKIDKGRTLLVGASNYNSIYELSRMVRLADENIIYTFHFYEPFFFTHQGATWVGDQVSTTGVPFPYSVEKFPALSTKAKGTWGETNYYQYRTDGNEGSIRDKMQIVKNWAAKYYVPILCSEYGVYNKYADADSRCRYIKAVNRILDQLQIPGILWEYNGNFSIFSGKPSMTTLPACMQDAIGFKPLAGK